MLCYVMLHFDRIHSSLTAVHCFDKWLFGKTASDLKRILYGVLNKELQKTMERFTGRCNVIEIMLTTRLSTIQLSSQIESFYSRSIVVLKV